MPIFKAFRPSPDSSQPPPPDPHSPSEPLPVQSTRSMPEEPQRKGLIARLRNIQVNRPYSKPEVLPDLPPEPPNPEIAAKAARRKARREKRTIREEEWNEEFRQRRNNALLVGSEMRPLTPLSDFDSASEDERQPVSNKPAPPHSFAPSQDDPLSDKSIHSSAPPPPSDNEFHPEDYQPRHVAEAQSLQTPPKPTPPPPPPRDSKEDAKLAEMFGAQAYAPIASAVSSAPQINEQTAQANPQNYPSQPSPIGWGGVYHSVPSQPMYGTPAHLTPVPRSVRDIDPILADSIRRGRELAMLAIEQEERGNLGAAEAGYIKALALLVPASKKLDSGSELNKNARMQQKAKIQREAAAMLDRCEELRTFLRANGPAVPSEMPVMPDGSAARRPTSSLKKQSSLGSPPSRNLPQPPSTDPLAPPSHPHAKSGRIHDLQPPPPPPPPPQHSARDHDRPNLLSRLTSRKDILASASTVMPSDGSRQVASNNQPPRSFQKGREPQAAEKCFMCSAPASLQTKCGHAYCSNCGNQAVSVFGQCPVPDCGTRIAVEDFEHIL